MKLFVENLAEALIEAERSRKSILPLTKSYPALSTDDAYRIQLEVIQKKLNTGRKIIGKKVGLTSKAMQSMLGVTEPDYGHLLDDMTVPDGEIVETGEMISPKIEAEIGFILGEDIKGPNITFLDVLMATEYVTPALEIIDSRIENWDIQLADTVADNGSSAKVVIGGSRIKVEEVDLRTVGMTLYKNRRLQATGAGAAALGHPAHAIAWLANKLSEFDIPLKAGELILPGALSKAIEVQSGDSISALFGVLGSVTVTFK
ncbi:2-keto-4-pentenoate hydratase [Heyndrickxia acidicola]|uniref:Fumarylacetoacetate hydrolase family protein n=1 Tax=Heyndrickxia acidicola TaxID=209389 RepID=A0ABU6MJI9_9BACI|nr:fumarylacetoacetate hydrolase family protein [Heyndrickxia acidicola]MED1204479.1 fumarylacetoacetate hydrolase family protein [Heyndrickxia acidicola]